VEERESANAWWSVECGRAVCKWGVPWESVSVWRVRGGREGECECAVECGVWVSVLWGSVSGAFRGRASVGAWRVWGGRGGV
jgi:hypothetical protein